MHATQTGSRECHLTHVICNSDAYRYGGGPEIMRECATEGSAEGGGRKVVAAVYFLRLTVHRSSSSENTACIIVSKQVRKRMKDANACKASRGEAAFRLLLDLSHMPVSGKAPEFLIHQNAKDVAPSILYRCRSAI
jgi:hypothetical protein